MKNKATAIEVKDYFIKILNKKTKKEALKLDSYLLMASFLSEIELVLENRKLTKSKLAQQIGIPTNSLRQIFSGDKPLNFITLAKIQQALGIRFSVVLKQTKKVPTTRKKTKLEYHY